MVDVKGICAGFTPPAPPSTGAKAPVKISKVVVLSTTSLSVVYKSTSAAVLSNPSILKLGVAY